MRSSLRSLRLPAPRGVSLSLVRFGVCLPGLAAPSPSGPCSAAQHDAASGLGRGAAADAGRRPHLPHRGGEFQVVPGLPSRWAHAGLHGGHRAQREPRCARWAGAARRAPVSAPVSRASRLSDVLRRAPASRTSWTPSASSWACVPSTCVATCASSSTATRMAQARAAGRAHLILRHRLYPLRLLADRSDRSSARRRHSTGPRDGAPGVRARARARDRLRA